MKKAVFVCDGQGSIVPGMGKELYEKNPVYRNAYDEVAAYADADLKDINWGSGKFKVKSNPYFAHIVLAANEYALMQCLLSMGYEPERITGHSLGEIFAIVFSGALSLGDGIGFIAKRGRLFLRNSSTSDSDMSALVAPADQTRAFLDEVGKKYEVYAANFNSERQTVVSLAKADNTALMSEALKSRIKYVPLGLGNGCHSPFMKPIEEELSRAVDELRFMDPAIPLYSASFDRELATGDSVRDALKAHLMAPVRWLDTVTSLREAGHKTYVEIGYSKVLKGLLLDINKELDVHVANAIVESADRNIERMVAASAQVAEVVQ